MQSTNNAMPSPKRLNYGPAKYAAFHLLLCRWMWNHAHVHPFRYVTLGGTELRDIQSLHYVDGTCAAGIVSYEFQDAECDFARSTSARLQQVGVNVEIRQGNIFSFERQSEEPHLFFIDLKGCCALADYDEQFASLLSGGHVRLGDSILVTSHLGARRGWNTLLTAFGAELDALEVQGIHARKLWFRRAHPTFTLFRALHRIGYHREIRLNCFGCVEYRDKSPMSILGYTVTNGTTSFPELVRQTPYFHVRHGLPAYDDPSHVASMATPPQT